MKSGKRRRWNKELNIEAPFLAIGKDRDFVTGNHVLLGIFRTVPPNFSMPGGGSGQPTALIAHSD